MMRSLSFPLRFLASVFLASSLLACGHPAAGGASPVRGLALGTGGGLAGPGVLVVDPGRAFTAGTLPVETHADAVTRARQPLDGAWSLRFDEGDRGVRDRWFAPEVATTLPAEPVQVPGAWDLANPQHYNRQAVAWYTRRFKPEALGPMVRLRFEGLFREGRVWLNGVELGGYDLPYLPFGFDVSAVLKPGVENTLVVRVDNRLTRTTLPADTFFTGHRHGWWLYGGLTRPVYLEGGLPTYPTQVRIDAEPSGQLSARLNIESPAGLAGPVAGEAWIEDAGGPIARWDLPPVTTRRVGLHLSALVPSPRLWTPETPGNRYTLRLKLSTGGREETSSYTFAFRRFEAKDGRFRLNGQDVFLRGLNRHEDHPVHGPVFDEQAFRRDAELIRGLSANFCRPGHYPNDVRNLQALETLGLMMAEEIPVYQLDLFQLGNAELKDRSKRSLEAMILRDYNRPGVVMWSVANEIHNFVPTAPGFVSMMVAAAKALDPRRPTMVAAVMIPPLSKKDLSSGLADAIGINEYFGWYIGQTTDASAYLKSLHRRFPTKTMFVSEYGADGLLGRHAPRGAVIGEEKHNDHSYTEEYQRFFHRQHLDQFERLPFIRGVMPWVFADFRYHWTPSTGKPHPVPFMNLKGLVSHDRTPKLVYREIADRYRRYQEEGH